MFGKLRKVLLAVLALSAITMLWALIVSRVQVDFLMANQSMSENCQRSVVAAETISQAEARLALRYKISRETNDGVEQLLIAEQSVPTLRSWFGPESRAVLKFESDKADSFLVYAHGASF